jgi:hypothetical protein
MNHGLDGLQGAALCVFGGWEFEFNLFHQDQPEIHHVGIGRACDEEISELFEEVIGVVILEICCGV